jgi:hypothetical protein
MKIYAIIVLFSVNIVFAQNNFVDLDDFNSLKHEVKIIQRDQLNYSIEKELLKETFSTNYQTINIILALILGVFTIVGLLGVRSINTIKKDYQSELRKLKILRDQSEKKINSAMHEQEKLSVEYTEIHKTNEEQEKKIKVLEFLEKSSSYIQNHNIQSALGYLNVANEMDDCNISVLRQRGCCFEQLKNYGLAIQDFEKILLIDASDNLAKSDLLELYLITEQPNIYDKKYDDFSIAFSDYENSMLLKQYFEVYREYISKKNVKNLITAYGLKMADDPAKRKIEWSFLEVQEYLKKKTQDNNTILFSLYIKLLSGAIDKITFKNGIERKAS